MPNSSTPLSFVAVGPPRTGTSWLHQVLKGRVNLPRFNKETRFFDERFHLGIDWYRAHYDESSKLPLGEICPTYFYSDEARRRLSSTQRRCRIICTFRDPVTRVFSLYKLKRAYAKVPWSFEDALQHDPELLESSRYAHYLSEWRRTFGAENVLVLFYEDLATNAQGYMDRVADFIGIPRFQLSDGDLQHINSSHNLAIPRLSFLTRFGDGTAEWLKARHWGKFASFLTSSPLRGIFLGGGQPIPRPLPSTLSMLRERFRVEVEDLEKLVDRDLSAWKYREVGASH